MRLRYGLSVLLIGLLWAPTMSLATFTDVEATHENFAAIQWMEGRGVIKGYDDGTFHPEWQVNRAEALKIILLASNIVVDENVAPEAEALFPDVKPDQWFYSYVEKALEMGIVRGYPDGTFRPERTVNWAEMLKMIYLSNGVDPGAVTRSPYPDVNAADWFAPYVSDAKDKNLISINPDGYFHPDWEVVRGDLTEVMYRFSYVEEFDGTVFPLALNWAFYQHPNANVGFQIPFGWKLVTGTNGELVAWYQDDFYYQKGWDRTTPHSAVVSLFWDSNEDALSTPTYFDQVREGLGAYGDIQQTNTVAADDYQALLLEYEGDYESMRDIVVDLPDGFLIVQGTYGKGRLAEQLGTLVREIQSSVRYSEPLPPEEPEAVPEDAVAEARTKIQKDGQGQTTLDLFEDRSLIETDTIGVGTGPVDYFYSEWADVTLKYERSFDVILDIETGQTTAF